MTAVASFGTVLDVVTHELLTCHNDQLCSKAISRKSVKTFMEAANIEGGIFTFTCQLQFVFINKVRSSPVNNPKIHKLIEK